MVQLCKSFIFCVKKSLIGEQYLRELSVSENWLYSWIDGKTVSLVGNARSLSYKTLGPKIDGCDVVIRLNDAPITSTESHGKRTDWLATAKTVAYSTLAQRNPSVVLWMASKRRKLSHNMVRYSTFYLNPSDRNAELKAELHAPPSIGLMMIDFLLRTNASRIEIYGFDFFASKSLTGRREAKDVPHRFENERAWVEKMAEADSRVFMRSSL